MYSETFWGRPQDSQHLSIVWCFKLYLHYRFISRTSVNSEPKLTVSNCDQAAVRARRRATSQGSLRRMSGGTHSSMTLRVRGLSAGCVRLGSNDFMHPSFFSLYHPPTRSLFTRYRCGFSGWHYHHRLSPTLSRTIGSPPNTAKNTSFETLTMGQ